MAIENLWGTAKTGTIVVTNQPGMLDLAFNDVCASWLSQNGTVIWSAVQNTGVSVITRIQNVTAEVRFRVTAATVNDSLQFDADAGAFVTLETFNAGNPPPTVLTTKSYNVTALFNSIAKINGARFRFTNTLVGAADWTVEIDEARLIVTYDTVSISQLISVQSAVTLELISFSPFVAGEYTFRYNRFHVGIQCSNPNVPCYLDDLIKKVDSYDVTVRGKDISVVAPGGANIIFEIPFGSVPAIVVTTQGTSPYKPIVTSKSSTGFTVKLYNNLDIEQSGVIDWVARGWWQLP